MTQTSLAGPFANDFDHERAARDVEAAFRAHLSPAFFHRSKQVAGVSQTGNPTSSLATCEKVPTSDEDADPSSDYADTAADLDYVTDATEAVRASIARSRERQRKVLALVQAGEVAHAKRLAYCNRQSVQLGCGDCGSEDNYVPVSCGSRLCPDCMNSKMGEVAGRYLPVVEDWEHPNMLRLSLHRRFDPDELGEAVDALRGAFGRLRRRKVPHNGDGWDWKPWKGILHARGEHRLAGRWDRERKQGRGIPMDEIIRTGFYGIDIKQGEDGTLNVHMHVLADIPYLPQAALSEIWGDLTDAPVVDIRRVEEGGGQDEESALLEVIGYAAKAPEYESVDDEVAYLQTLKGSKLVQPFGDLHGNTPPSAAFLLCCDCGCSPDQWNYLGVVDGRYETVEVVGQGAGGDRPPPSS